MRLGEIGYSEITEEEKARFCILWKRKHKRSPEEALKVMERRGDGATLKEIGIGLGINASAVRVILFYAEQLIRRIREVDPL